VEARPLGPAGPPDPLTASARSPGGPGPGLAAGEPGEWVGDRHGEVAPPPEVAAGPTGDFGLYLHALFCRVRCPYCDFNVAIYRDDRLEPFLAALGREMALYADLPWAGRRPAVSLFLGGGTPSLLPPDAVGRLIETARGRLGLQPDAEVTLEANPEGLDAARLAGFRAAGVTRLSLGVQSLDDGLLRRLGREHTAADARRAFQDARQAGFPAVSVDLLYGCPGQDLQGWVRTLDEALAWGPDHLSAYGLTLEPGTPFGRRPPPDLPDEAAVLAQREALEARTAEAGLARYEISNFARPGFASRHNRLYWARADYVGLGPGAHGAFGRLRLQNVRAHTRYATVLAAGRWPMERGERVTPAQARGERIMLGLRLAEGVPRAWLDEHFAETPEGLARALGRFLDAGLVREAGGRLALTRRGVVLSDTVLAELV
jgi:oxygen-independent coproporphyrinogen-3 oxidase